MNNRFPPGQRARGDFPRFGLTPFATRFPGTIDSIALKISGDVMTPTVLSTPFQDLERVEHVSDFHCVTTWSHCSLRWSGVRFADIYRQHIEPLVEAGEKASSVILRGQDGYRTSLPLSDLLADEVLLADRLNGQVLDIAHGAPLRLVAPAHYGYKSVKHLSALEFRREAVKLKRGLYAFMDHPRARVACEERGRWFPGWLLRYVYRPLIRSTVAKFAKASAEYGQRQSAP